MKENIALLLAILYLIYRYKTYSRVNKIIEDRIENVHKPFFKRIQDVVNVNIRMYNFDDVQCTVIPSAAYGFVTGMNLQLC